MVLQKRGKRAVVIGGSVAGLLSATVLADFFEEVLILERDCLEEDHDFRRGVPQSTQPHVLLVKGYRILKSFFPGLDEDFLRAGAVPVDWGRDFHYFIFGGWNAVAEAPTELRSFSCSRPLLEQVIRNRVNEVENVHTVSSSKVTGFVGNADHISGVNCTSVNAKKDKITISADLVVDASGRSSNAPKWLSHLNSPAPKVDIVDAGLGYATQRYRVEGDWDCPWKVMIVSHEPPENPRLGYIARIEGNEFIATLGGYCKEYPPVGQTEFLAYSRTLKNSYFYDLVSRSMPTSVIKAHRATANRRYRYETLQRLPKGFVAIGDSVCALCPPYGQGLTVSALSTVTLQTWLASSRSGSFEGLSFHKKLAKTVEPAWLYATGFDIGFNNIKGGRRRNIAERLFVNYVEKLVKKGQSDSTINIKLASINHMVEGQENFLHPTLLAKLWA